MPFTYRRFTVTYNAGPFQARQGTVWKTLRLLVGGSRETCLMRPRETKVNIILLEGRSHGEKLGAGITILSS
jgi:hypothetical protein